MAEPDTATPMRFPERSLRNDVEPRAFDAFCTGRAPLVVDAFCTGLAPLVVDAFCTGLAPLVDAVRTGLAPLVVDAVRTGLAPLVDAVWDLVGILFFAVALLVTALSTCASKF